jgi:hypothetical protein
MGEEEEEGARAKRMRAPRVVRVADWLHQRAVYRREK